MEDGKGKAGNSRKTLRTFLLLAGVVLMGISAWSMYNATRLGVIAANGEEVAGVIINLDCPSDQLMAEINGQPTVINLVGKAMPCEDYNENDTITLRHLPGSEIYVRDGESYQGKWLLAALWAIIGISLLVYLPFSAKKKS
jgi:hypothetical protein